MKIKASFYLCLAIVFISSINIFSQAPVITKQPHTHGVIQGQTATFSVEASGDTLTYQWYLNDTPIGGATDSTYTTPAATLLHNGEQFFVVVSNTHGNDTSNVVTLYVTATNSRVTASQIALYNFKEGNGNIINDQAGFGTPLNLTINNTSSVDWSDNGLYVTDGAMIKSAPSAANGIQDAITATNEMTVELWIRPLSIRNDRIINLTHNQTEVDFGIESIPAFNGYNFVVRTTNTDDKGVPGIEDTLGLTNDLIQLTFTHFDGISKIYRDGVLTAMDTIGGDFSTWVYQVALSLGSHLNGSYPFNGIFYLASISNRALDSVEVAHNYSIGVSGTNLPFIIEEPQNSGLLEGYTATFSVNAISDSPLSYRWQKYGVDIPGATDSSYTTPAVTLADSGSVYRVIVTNSSGNDTSNNAILQVTTANPDCPDGIAHYYHLDESASPYKDFVGFSDGTSSVPPASATGIVGAAQSFSNQKIDIPDDVSFDWALNESFSIEFWMKTNSTPSGVTVMVGRDDAISSLQWWIGLNSSGQISFQLTDNDNNLTGIGDKDPVVNDNEWHLIAVIRDNNVNKNYLYIDGNKIDSANTSYSAGFESSSNVNLGYLNTDPYYYYSGLLDEVAFYNVDLSQSTILEHYYKGMKGYGYCSIIPPVATPSNLIAIKNSTDSTQVDLSWQDNSSNELGFVIQRKLGDTTSVALFAAIDTVGADVVTYTDTTVSDTTTYTYRVYAYNADTVSQFSNLAQVTTPVPVELTSFSVSSEDGKVHLLWETATELNNAGFSIEKSKDNIRFSEIAFIEGNGTTTDKSSYSYTDNAAQAGKYYYRLKQVDLDGSFHYSKTVEVDLGIPKQFSLDQNYPNPFNPATTIRFALPMNAKVNIKLYNTLGQEVANILNSDLSAGVHETTFNASNLSSGVYFYKLEVHGIDGSNFISTKRMLLMK